MVDWLTFHPIGSSFVQFCCYFGMSRRVTFQARSVIAKKQFPKKILTICRRFSKQSRTDPIVSSCFSVLTVCLFELTAETYFNCGTVALCIHTICPSYNLSINQIMPRPSNKLMFLRCILRMFVTMKVGNHEGAAIVFPGQRHYEDYQIFIIRLSFSKILSYLQNTTGYRHK